MQKVLIALAVVTGLLLAWVDLLPNFDDTGVLVGLLLVVSALLALLSGRQPWFFALAVGLWIPVHDVISSHNFGSLLALAVAFVGAYAGWTARKVFQNSSGEKHG